METEQNGIMGKICKRDMVQEYADLTHHGVKSRFIINISLNLNRDIPVTAL